jgi:hypothetical protein
METYGQALQVIGDNIIQHMHIAYWKPKTINTHSAYVTLNAFSRQQWLDGRASISRAYVHCLSG